MERIYDAGLETAIYETRELELEVEMRDIGSLGDGDGCVCEPRPPLMSVA
ncbi:MAG: hypothetical protein OXC83_03965 [Chloroflexi bacterium]|nr:hypothetical protein [Chloroflexota bacterium]